MTPSSKHPAFVVREQDPFNAGAPLDLLASDPVTPNALFFVRSHAPVPAIDPAAFRLTVAGLVHTPLSLSLADLNTRFARHVVPAALMCAGNRRQELYPLGDIKGELPWDLEAIGCAVWGGVRLRDVLAEAGIAAGAAHIAFTGLDAIPKNGGTFPYGASIPLDKALHEDVLLADSMNSEPLPPDHGYPLRVIVPGYIGARAVKWLGHIQVQASPSDNYYQAQAYKHFPPHITEETADWDAAPMLGGLFLTSAITQPQAGDMCSAGVNRVRGYALPAENERITAVEFSPDGGATWLSAALIGDDQPNVWRLWEVEIDLAPGEHELIVRAHDSGGNIQPQHVRETWNFKGYMNNAWHRVRVTVES